MNADSRAMLARGHGREPSILLSILGELTKETDLLFFRADPHDMSVTFATPNAAEVFGYPAEAFTSDSGFWPGHLHPDDRPRVFSELASLVEAKGQEYTYRYRFLHGDGTYKWYQERLRIEYDEEGLAEEVYGCIRQLPMAAATPDRLHLLRGFSHDLRNPLNAAAGFAALLADGVLGELNERQQESLRRIKGALARSIGLIDDLIELGRAEAGELVVRAEDIDLREVVAEVVESYQAVAQTRNVRLNIFMPATFPRITTDPGRVRQILENLISNAIKFSPENGFVRLTAGLRGVRVAEGDTQWVRIDVTDRGPGIPRNKRHLLFKEFSQLHSGGLPGFGMGLAISRRLAEGLGGEITVQSEEKEGSTFTLWLPVRT